MKSLQRLYLLTHENSAEQPGKPAPMSINNNEKLKPEVNKGHLEKVCEKFVHIRREAACIRFSTPEAEIQESLI